jgi:hypothetical protein
MQLKRLEIFIIIKQKLTLKTKQCLILFIYSIGVHKNNSNNKRKLK